MENNKTLIQKEFPSKDMKLTNIYTNPKIHDFKILGIDCPKVKDVYGTVLNFPYIPENRPYIFGSFVITVDGKLAYEDNPGAFEVAGRNHYAGLGSMTDFWWLNVLRSACDGTILGAKSISIEPEYTGHCWDKELEDYRLLQGKYKIPWNIVVTTDATDIPFEHIIFTNKEIPSVISAAPLAKALITKKIPNAIILDIYETLEDVNEDEIKLAFSQKEKTIVILTGKDNNPDMLIFLNVLRKAGICKLLSESPTYTHLLIKEEVFDEGFFNISCVYIGGNVPTLGKFDIPFKSIYHPHTEVMSIAMHSPHMLFFRHKFIYGIDTK